MSSAEERIGPDRTPRWHAAGLLFENCTCQIVCPGHVHFDQLCTHDRCKGWWAIRIDEEELGGVSLAGVKAVVAMDSPRHMIDGGWVETIVIDEAASAEQRRAVERILSGRVGGPWEVLGRFVGKRTETRFSPIRIEERPTAQRVDVKGVLRGVVKAIRGRDRRQPVRFENCFNQIHASSQVIASGDCEYDDIKNACLRRCRSLVALYLTSWRSGPASGFRIGARHGLVCVACCWALMALAFASGVMSLLGMALLTGIVCAQKLLPRGDRLPRFLGAALLVGGMLLLI